MSHANEASVFSSDVKGSPREWLSKDLDSSMWHRRERDRREFCFVGRIELF